MCCSEAALLRDGEGIDGLPWFRVGGIDLPYAGNMKSVLCFGQRLERCQGRFEIVAPED